MSHPPPSQAVDSRFPAPLAGLLSFLVPGLGQIYQGRTGKGLLFLVCLYGMFFTGMRLGDWKNVYIPDTGAGRGARFQFAYDLWTRPQYAGQFWIGIAAWPAIWQYKGLPTPSAEKSVFWHYFQHAPPERPEDKGYKPYEHWEGKSLTELQRDGDKTWDLGWVYTVIAGVLNLLVIYDAFAGPATGIASRAVRAEGAPV
jgi:hypothetical protein